VPDFTLSGSLWRDLPGLGSFIAVTYSIILISKSKAASP